MLYFGRKKEGIDYPIREGVYGILLREEDMLVIKTPRGYFLPGGGIESGEDHKECLIREFEEETGMIIRVGDYITSNKEFGFAPGLNKHIEMIGHYYYVIGTGRHTRKTEEDHEQVWLNLLEASFTLKITLQAFIPSLLFRKGNPPTLFPYDPHWKGWFKAISYILYQTLGPYVDRIEHVGSTSIEGMLSKPIIDIDVLMKMTSDFERVKSALNSIGYDYEGNQGIIDREVFKRGGKDPHDVLDNLPHHLYVCPNHSKEFKRHIHFRNQLNENMKLRHQYCDIKRDIISKVGQYNREAYVELKANGYQEFFDQIHRMKKVK